MEILPSTDLISVKNTILKDDISAYTIREDSIRTDGAPKSLFGSFNDPVFGNTTVDFATQFRLVGYPDFGEAPEADSIFLYLYYRKIFGDTVTTQKVRVYELEENLYADQEDGPGGNSSYPYYQNVDLKSMASDQLIGELDFVPQITLDSTETDTFYQVIKVPLDISLADKLIDADSADMSSNDVFLNYFKGLYIETEKLTDAEGAILALEAASDDSFQGSAVVVYYNNEENKNAEEPDTLNMPYIVTEFSARVNHIEHDYSGTPFFGSLNNSGIEDSLLYIQTAGGLESKIDINNLSLWQDSVNTAINKAELVFQVDTIKSDLENYPAPNQLLFTFIDSTGQEFLPKDYSFSPAFYGGVLDTLDYTYRFNVTQHLQQIIDGEVGNFGFKLTTAAKNSEAKRVVLKGSTSETGIQLIITYSKFLQQ
ncbi:DUF4270 domain-containing protein [Maribellus comscasis]|nr:DUF4270 domain-containing protein [Maribellus comscasis]